MGEDNNFVENEEEQESIQYIHARHTEDGITMSQIVRELNECGVPTNRGKNGLTDKSPVSQIIGLFPSSFIFTCVRLDESHGLEVE